MVDKWLKPKNMSKAHKPPKEIVWALILYLNVMRQAINADTDAPIKNIGSH